MRPVIGPLTAPHEPQAFEPCSGTAALAMALEAIDPIQAPWEDLQRALWRQATGHAEMPGAGPSRELWPQELALAALKRGAHVTLLHQPRGMPWREHLHAQGYDPADLAPAYEQADNRARGAGLVVDGGRPTEARIRQGAEAGHPMLLLIDGSLRHDEREPFPHWVTLVGLTEDQLMLHDPLDEGGPVEELSSRLPALQGYEGTEALLEIAPGNCLPERG